MHPLAALVAYLLFVFVGGALLSPWIYQGVQSLAASFPAVQGLAGEPFPRYLNRCWLLLAVLGLWPLLRLLGIKNWRDAGLSLHPPVGRSAWAGLVLGLTSLAVVMIAAVLFGARTLDFSHSPGAWARFAVQGLAAATVVAVLEEVIFRGALFGGLRRAYRWPVAAALSSVVFAVVHFLRSPEASGSVDGMSGFRVLATMIGVLPDSGLLSVTGLNLLLVGLALAMAYQFTGTLAFSIGLHAGWIICQKGYRFLTDAADQGPRWFWGGNRLIDGWMASCALAAAVLFLWLQRERRAGKLGRQGDDYRGQKVA